VKADNKVFLGLLKKIRFRIGLGKAVNNLLLALTAALAFGAAAAVVSWLIPIYNLYYWIAIVSGAICIGSILFSLVKRPSLYNAALTIDSYGLNERTVTAFELIENDEDFSEFQKRDALEHLKRLDYKQHIKLVPNFKYALAVLILLTAITVSAFIPNPMREVAIERHTLSELKKEEMNKVKKVEKELAKNDKLTPIEKAELNKKLTELKKDLKEAKSEKEINKAIEKTDKKLEMVKAKYDKEELKKLADTFAKSDVTKNLSDLINTGNTQMLKEALKAVAEQMKNLSAEEKKALAENMAKLAEELKNNEELKNALASLSQKLASGELGDLDEELSQFASTIQELMNSDEFREAVAQMQSALKEGQGGALSAQTGNSQNSSGNQGSGNQQGQGSGGSGAGSGTGMGQENQTPTGSQSTGLNKKGSSEKKSGEYEKIFTSKTVGGEGETSQLTGKKNSSGTSEQINTEKGINTRGEAVPYNKVFGSYRDKALESIGSSEIPEGMKEVIKNYFSSLEE
jgi:hypothetical protein